MNQLDMLMRTPSWENRLTEPLPSPATPEHDGHDKDIPILPAIGFLAPGHRGRYPSPGRPERVGIQGLEPFTSSGPGKTSSQRTPWLPLPISTAPSSGIRTEWSSWLRTGSGQMKRQFRLHMVMTWRCKYARTVQAQHVVVGVASWILPDGSPRIGQFVYCTRYWRPGAVS